MKTVQKFPLAFMDGPQSVQIPATATMLHAHLVWDVPHVWALVDTEAATVERFVSIIGDGKVLPPDGVDAKGKAVPAQYIATVSYQEHFWNLFETAAP
jgi:hypothetical protein